MFSVMAIVHEDYMSGKTISKGDFTAAIVAETNE